MDAILSVFQRLGIWKSEDSIKNTKKNDTTKCNAVFSQTNFKVCTVTSFSLIRDYFWRCDNIGKVNKIIRYT
jgi:hypothetical protein